MSLKNNDVEVANKKKGAKGTNEDLTLENLDA